MEFNKPYKETLGIKELYKCQLLILQPAHLALSRWPLQAHVSLVPEAVKDLKGSRLSWPGPRESSPHISFPQA